MTSYTYSSPVQYFNAHGELQASTTAEISFGISGGAAGPHQAGFIIKFADGMSELKIGTEPNDIRNGTANGIVADLATGNGNVVVVTREGEIFIFKAPQAGEPPTASVGFGN
jgi:hypothetical protein